MYKNIIASILIVAAVFFIGKGVTSHTLDKTPTLQENQEEKQRKIDEKIFSELKEKIKGEVLPWADGEAEIYPKVDSGAYIVVDGTGKPILAKDADTRRSPASLVKLVTTMVALDLAEKEEVFETPKEAVGMEPTILIVDEGEKFTLEELLKAALITSANDAAEIIAYGVSKKYGGFKNLFTLLMNEKVKKLGLVNTNFTNATGYDDENQYSTPRDLAKIANYALVYYPDIKELVKTETAFLEKTSDHKFYKLPNWNALLGVYPGVNGVKIGYTERAGYVTIVTARQDNKEFIVVLLGAPDQRARDVWSAQLLNSAFKKSFYLSHFTLRKIISDRLMELNKLEEQFKY